jgi:hypothetical protein
MNPVLPTITVFMTDEEAKRYVAFQKYYLLVGLLESIKALDVKSGSIEIHFDHLGQIKSLEKHESYHI